MTLDRVLAAFAGLLALALYVRTLAPGVLGGDSGELQFAAWLASLPHPTGYPLYMLLGNAWTHLWPFGDPAYRMNLLSALCAAAAVALFYLLALRALRLAVRAATGANPAALRLLAFGGAALFAAGPTFWSQAVVAEVYALHAVFVIGILLALLTWGDQPSDRRSDRPLYLAAALFGLGLAHHRSTMLLAPAILLYVGLISAGEKEWLANLARRLRAVPLMVLPLLLYLYVPLRAPYTPYERIALDGAGTLQLYQPTLAGFWQYATGQIFGAAFRSPAAAWAQAGAAAQLFVNELSWPVLALGAAGLLGLSLRPAGRRLLGLTGSAFLAVAIFNLFYGIGDIYVYYIPAYLIWVLWAVLGLGLLSELITARRYGFSRSGWPPTRAEAVSTKGGIVLYVAGVAALLLAGWSLAAHYGQVDQSGNRRMAEGWANLLAQPVPQRAILISNDRDEMMPMWYEQYVAGKRQDLAGLFPLIVPGSQWGDVGQVTEQALASGRPVFLVKPMPGLDVRFRMAQEGPLVRVLGPAADGKPQHAADLDFGDALRLAGYDLDPAQPRAGDTITVALYWQPLRPITEDYAAFVHLTNGGGTVIGQDDHRPGGVYYPSHLWRTGDVLKDVHTFRLSTPDPGSPPYTLVAGLYTLAPDLTHLGEPQDLGPLDFMTR